MKVARVAVLVVALVAGVIAWLMARDVGRSDAPQIVEHGIETDEVLIAARDIRPGERIVAGDLTWERWPSANIAAGFVRRGARPSAIEANEGAIARNTISEGEPIRPARLVQAGSSSFLSAALPSGMRAISTRTSPQTGAGGFIMPNDRVDVVLTRRESAGRQRQDYVSELVLSNVRVLAIDQTVEEQDGKTVVVGNVATLELLPEQTEILAIAEQLGDITLALRSIAEEAPPELGDGPVASAPGDRRAQTVGIVRFGVPSRASTY